MKVLHISAECYPAAKAGGLGDVVGALPKYLTAAGMTSGVIIPKYDLQWIRERLFSGIYSGTVRLHDRYFSFTIEKAATDALGYPFFVADIPGLFDRPGIYADPNGHHYEDSVERYLAFSQAVLQWIMHTPGQPGVLHCHDHHTGLIPFFVKYCPEYAPLRDIPTVITVHNGRYHGSFGWDQLYQLPFFEPEGRGLLDWNQQINPLATAIKCAWRVTTVSPNYFEEMKQDSGGLEWLFEHEQHKTKGILNGIDTKVWDPRADTYIAHPLSDSLRAFKAANKRVLAQHFHIDARLPVIAFIGRLVGEKGADLLPDLMQRVIHSGMNVAFVVLGTGEPQLMDTFAHLRRQLNGRFDAALEFNEALAHQLYAGSDFLLMPSRVEPCGLNQMYAMRYATLPIVRSVGGLRDTVPDIGEPDGEGRGIRFNHFNLDDGHLAIYRAAELYHNRYAQLEQIRERLFRLDFSWEKSAAAYREIYDELIN